MLEAAVEAAVDEELEAPEDARVNVPPEEDLDEEAWDPADETRLRGAAPSLRRRGRSSPSVERNAANSC